MARSLLSPLWYRVAALRPRLRPHVQITRQHFRGELWYLAEDTAHNRYHRFPPAAYAALSLMDGNRTVDEIWKELAQLEDTRPTQDEMIRLLAQLDGADMLASDRQPDFAELAVRSRKQTRQRMIRRLITPLYLRIPLLDPDRFLTAWAPLVRPLWSFWGLMLWLTVVGWGLVHAALNWTLLTQDITDRVLASDNVVILVLTFPLVKILHEFGHGFAAKLGGGEVHEAGVMTLIFLPVPYIDVTSATALPSRWQRALIGAAGMMVEVFLASIAMLVWLSVEPGVIRAAAFNTMVIAGVSTLIFNGNPLLRFDAYYILCDLIEIPNLATRAGRYYGYLVNRFLFQVPDAVSPVSAKGESAWFVLYAPASYIYRLTVMASIALFVAGALHGLGVILAVWTVGVGVALPIARAAWYLASSPQLRHRRLRALAITGTAGALAYVLLFVAPLPYGTVVEGVVWAPPGAEVRAAAEGTILSLDAVPGSVVEKASQLVTMSDPLLDARVHVLEAELSEVQLRYFAAQDDDQVRAQIFQRQTAYFASELAEARKRHGDLELPSPASGQFLVGLPQDLPGRYVRRGELIGHVVDGRAAAIRVMVPQSAIDLVRQDTRAIDVRFASDPLVEFHSPATIGEVPTATRDLPTAALSVTGGGEVSTDPADEKHLRAVEMLFQLDVQLPKEISVDRLGERVYVRFDHGTRTLAWRIGRGLRQLVLRRFEL